MIFSGIRYEGLRVLDMKKTYVEYTETLDDEMSKALTESVILCKALFDLAETGDSVSSDVLSKGING
jgi:hypothetical protein